MKEFVKITMTDIARVFGGLDKVRAMNQSINMTQFFAGWICGLVHSIPGLRYLWAEPGVADVPLTQEEIRRVTDYVRLLIETDSTGST